MPVINIPTAIKTTLDQTKTSWESFDELLNRLMDKLPLPNDAMPRKRKFQSYDSVRMSQQTKDRLDSFMVLGESYASKIHQMIILDQIRS